MSPPASKHRKKRTRRREREVERLQQAQRLARGPAGQAQAGVGDPGKSIGALGEAAGRGQCGDDQQTEAAEAVIAECFQPARAPARHQDRLCGRRACPGHPLPTSEAGPHHRSETAACPGPTSWPTPRSTPIRGALRSPCPSADCSPDQVYFTLLDEGTYLASVSSFYRILRANNEVRERRRQATHPAKVKPELVADKPLVAAELGYHQAEGSSPGRVLRPLRRDRHLLPLRGGLVGGPNRVRRVGYEELIADAVARHNIGPDQPLHPRRPRFAR